MADYLVRAIAHEAGILISAAITTELTERARQIHHLAPTACAALGRALTATSMMGDQLKTEDGSVTLQIRGNGPLGTIVCVADASGNVRGYVQNPACDLPLRESDHKLDVGGAVGCGYLNVIRDIGMKEPVTGTVALTNGEIAADLTRYFAESEQIPSAVALGVLVDRDYSVKAAGGWIAQLMPGVREADIDRLEQNLAKMPPVTAMLEQGKTAEQIIEAVLDGYEVDFLDKAPIAYRCNCSRERVTRALISMGREELQKMADEQPESEITCQFCDKIYHFTGEELHQILQEASH